MGVPNGEGLLPTHILVTDELVERAWDAALDTYEEMNMSQQAWRAALSAVAPDLYDAGVEAGKRLRDTGTDDSDTTREVGTGGGYKLDATGEVQAVEEEDGAEATGDVDQAGQEGVGQSPGTGWWKSPPTGAAESD